MARPTNTVWWTSVSTERPRIVILGAGFGGLFAARALAKVAADVTLVDRHNYHLFQPLLYQVATAGLPPSDIAWPIRSILSRQRNVRVLLAEVTGIDVAKHEVELHDRTLAFDYLVVATGSTHSYFGHEEWQALAPGLKSIDDATHIRRRILRAFEAAEIEEDAAARERLLRFVIVGGGPTGVELAGTIAELAHHTLAKDFRRIDPSAAKVVLVEAGPRLLAAFHEPQAAYAARALEKLGVEVRVGAAVTACDARGVALGAQRIEAATVLWAAGVAASPVGRWLGLATDRAGRVPVRPDLSVASDPAIFVVGDAALVETGGKHVPGVAPAAKQQGRYVARALAARVAGGPAPPPFVYRDAGNLATIGRQRAVIEFPFITLRGWLAWWIWGFAHIYFLVGVPSPVVISLRWLWEYLTYGRGARLITGSVNAD
ncbi:MAG TPA: NAD(P)/FAD-dependent oxidoreductase [Gammaproteobacteria bacterium]|nr:NAD(P)/FAD-dependent oxidoreductase [Gammaproteobacteria bacterium]